MIVKNEEKVLARCLDSLEGLYDELIIVDTGSSDSTKSIAAGYTDKIFDFEWINDFSAARNFAFSKATMEYIYSADADEVLDEENRLRFKILKENLLPEIEIV
ncbi:MAG: glycosyltransferase, partial [Lachnospiraceae bacterium]|nr:glycosyltransferase [Lachnospiraceae bacterium]